MERKKLYFCSVVLCCVVFVLVGLVLIPYFINMNTRVQVSIPIFGGEDSDR